ncbi:MAG: type I methionyl aminopeptidase [Candidatus Magasanikbacteria bacterium]|nr:type I methionyl aminopeptidase [Candidatus Magasanikbacteria bacterium]
MEEKITIKNKTEIEEIKKGGKLLGNILRKLADLVKPGFATDELEKKAEKMIEEIGGRPSFKNFKSKGEKPYPCALCVSIDEEVVHAPSLPSRILREGQIVSIDVGMQYPAKGGYYTDMAVTVAVGKISKEAARLIVVTRQALFAGIKAARPGRPLSNIGKAIEKYVKRFGYGIVRDLVGHGVGYAVHEAPRIPNFFDPSLSRVLLEEGMVLAIEPMITLGSGKVAEGSDGFTIKTADGAIAAHFEHTIVITQKGSDIVTLYGLSGN